jgi:putative addiction module killer protein
MMRSVELSEFSDWLASLRDKQAVARIVTRVTRLRLGNSGDCKSVGEGVFELRFAFGPGYRAYFAYRGEQLILLLAGGDKSTQARDIAKAKNLLLQWKEH